jgi:hypothetical protein
MATKVQREMVYWLIWRLVCFSVTGYPFSDWLGENWLVAV